MTITARRRCDVCLKFGPVRNTGLRWLCRACWNTLVRPDVTFDEGPKDAA